ncbi:MAG TPA: DNA gyrase subunit A, partial [Chloroflexota bacterium]|nr:DNA gyrase subunit A [Chloroflexota bacterium]
MPNIIRRWQGSEDSAESRNWTISGEFFYQTMARLAQDFTLRYPLVDGQGNMGSIDNDPPAAARYTEARLTAVAEVLLKDVDQQTVPLVPTYLQDPRITEPLYLTGHLPPVVNPISGVAVAMATNVPPHNLTE